MRTETKRRAGKPSPQAPVRRRMLGRKPLDELEPAIQGSIDAVDEIVMLRLREFLCGFSDRPIAALLSRKLLPHKITSAFTTAETLSRWLVVARSAQVLTGVPASILLAEVLHASTYLYDVVVPRNDWFETGRSYESLGAALLDHAFYLRDAKEFQSVMRARNDRVGYLDAIGKCKLWEWHDARDRVDFIAESDLLECDVLPMGNQAELGS